ncbi:MAG: hypothetical protein ACKO37_01290 [Vampirovibrionales bacterium]
MDIGVFINLTKDFWTRQNPIGNAIEQAKQSIDYLINLKSHKKIMKFRYKMYEKQVNDLETAITTASITDQQGQKLYRKF